MLGISLVALASATMDKDTYPGDAKRPPVFAPVVSANPLNPSGRPVDDGQKNPIPRGNPGEWANARDYPLTALQERREGTTGFRVEVDSDGKVANCTITLSSGFADLDAATCIKVFQRAEFDPARNTDGVPIPGAWSSRVRWEIPNFGYGKLTNPINSSDSFPRAPKSLLPMNMPVSKSDYPTAAFAEKREGVAIISLEVTPEGLGQNCEILNSSGHQDLDQQSCAIATRDARFEPALDVGGQPTLGKINQTVSWSVSEGKVNELKDALSRSREPRVPPVPARAQEPKPGLVEVTYVIKGDGSVTDCQQRKEGSAESSRLPNICDMITKVRYKPILGADGKAVDRRVKQKSEVTVDPIG